MTGKVALVRGDITAQAVDAIVNAANSSLHGGGAGDLPARFVIHAVGPVWQGGSNGEDDLLASCHRRSLEVAAELGCVTVAFPAISTGIYRFPVERAAGVALRTTIDELGRHRQIDEVRFVLFSDEHLLAFERALTA